MGRAQNNAAKGNETPCPEYGPIVTNVFRQSAKWINIISPLIFKGRIISRRCVVAWETSGTGAQTAFRQAFQQASARALPALAVSLNAKLHIG
jgi:hypothetical protein